jgi:hypothetical protein
MQPSSSLFEAWIARPRHPWINVGFALACLVVPFLAVWAEGHMDWLLETDQWRALLIPPTIIAYILAAAPRMATMDSRVIESLQPLLDDSDASVTRVVRETGVVAPRNEVLAFGCGVAFALLLNARGVLIELTWLELVMLLEVALMYGLLAVVIYGSIHSTRVTGALLRQHLRVNPLDVSPFEAVGRQSLLLSLVFVGGITLSLLLVGVSPAILRRWEFWAIYAPLVSIPVVVFFLNMAPTHRLLQAARDVELRRVDGLIRQACASLVRELEQGVSAAESAQRVSALTAYEARLLQARTWPYNTAMLRAVFVSILVPGGTVIGRLVMEVVNS